MNTPTERLLAPVLPPLQTATRADIRDTVERVAAELARTVVERDRSGGTAHAQRQLLRDSGLLTLSIPSEYGGKGYAWPDIYPVIRRLTEADSSLGHLFAFQHLQVASILLFGNEQQQADLLTKTVIHKWFWGNATNGRDPRLQFTQNGSGYELHGTKSFCSGATDADALVLTAPIASTPGGLPDDRIFLAIPTDRVGLLIDNDWDGMGQRQTDSGSVYFTHVAVHADEILGGADILGPDFTAPRKTPRQTLRSTVSQLILTEIYIGNTLGALRDARDYVVNKARPWPGSDADNVADDRYIQKHYGELWVLLQGSIALADKAALLLQQAWLRGNALTEAERGEAALAVFTAKASATRAALEITSRVFETMGAGAAIARHGYDRYWRNVRTHTLHDPVDYKFKDIGRWLLSGQVPEPGTYS
jgi:alkylation response protein AidB-like acyl-CoA dehydrogenase